MQSKISNKSNNFLQQQLVSEPTWESEYLMEIVSTSGNNGGSAFHVDTLRSKLGKLLGDDEFVEVYRAIQASIDDVDITGLSPIGKNYDNIQLGNKKIVHAVVRCVDFHLGDDGAQEAKQIKKLFVELFRRESSAFAATILPGR